MIHSGHNWTLHNADCRDVLAGMADASVDAVVTDPPYELAFMGKRWDASGIAFNTGLWREVLRVLKPGGHLLGFGGTRTSHRMVCAIEDAGFEIRDSIHWAYGSGFPKSLDVSKAIDAAAGAVREVVGQKAVSRIMAGSGDHVGGTVRAGTVPATVPATVWNGWGTALKPAHEPICVARKPLIGTVAANVQTHGTGGINVDGCRLPTADRLTSEHQGGAGHREDYRTGGKPGTPFRTGSESGRFPANFLLTHSPGCLCLGSKDVANQSCHPGARGAGGLSTSGHRGQVDLVERRDPTETVPAWDCAPDCPVGMLDGQSGDIHPAGSAQPPQRKWARDADPVWIMGGIGAGPSGARIGDIGTASRFFPTFAWEPSDFPPFKYVAKASTSERERGCDRLPKRTAAECVDREPDAAAMDCPRTGAGRTSGGRANVHPTVKPVALMAWLVRLVTPPNGLVLDPFAGSGTTGVAALKERMRFVGCELSPEYAAIAKARLEDAARQPDLFAAEVR